MANLPGGVIVCEVFAQLQAIGVELERLHPKLYTGVCRQVSMDAKINVLKLWIQKRG